VPLDLNRVITNYLTLLRPLIGEDITIVTHLETPLWTIHADQGQIEQVIMNLAVNARDAMPRGGRLVLETQNVDPYAPDALPSLSMKPGCYVSLVVRDSGCGMSAETKARIFDPFFTTKGKGKGTGLGLATVYGIVKQSGGEIWVDSEIGRGTSFRLFFPRAKEAPAPRRLQPDPARSDGLGGSETVLLVEDDDTVRALAKNTLARYGYHVLEARCGEEALEVLRRQSDPIHLLLTDIVMPGLDGRKLTERAVEMRPDIKVLMMSGYVDKPFPTSNGPDPRAAFLQKPFTPTGLARMVRSTLDAPHLPAAVAFT
jgi:CheY-like chemotaxis protein